MSTELERFIREQKNKLEQERRELDDAIAKFMRNKSPKTCRKQDPARELDVERRIEDESPSANSETMNKNKNKAKKKVTESEDEPPKYGLPGIGQYEEKRKQYEEEWKKECRKHFAEEAARPNHRAKPQSETLLDYDTILTQRREEENRYRQTNGENYYGRNIKAATSDSYLNRDPENGYRDYSDDARNIRPEIEELDGTDQRESRPKHLSEYADSDDGVYQYNRPHSYPQPYNSSTGSWQPDKPDSDPGLRDYENRVSDVQRRSFSLPRNGIKSKNENPSRQSPKDILSRPRSPVFITLNGQNSDSLKPADRRVAYQADLAKQMEETRLRKQKEKEEQMRYDRKIDEENSNYNPWGRGGAGAPRRDSQGNIIANRSRAQQGRSLPRFEDHGHVADNKKAVRYQGGLTDQRKFPEPIVPKKKEGKNNTGNYQLDLQQQILEKKQRELEEREKELMEEAAWTRRIEEQQEKMKREYNEELRKQQMREEQLRKRNEELRGIQEQERLEAQRKLRDGREQARKEWWEAQQRGQNFQEFPEVNYSNGNSPPIPATRRTELPVLEKPAEAGTRVPMKANNKPDTARLTTVYPSRTHILSQLSVMRQQLEQEQKALQEQLQKQKTVENYNVYDRKPPTMPIKKREKPVEKPKQEISARQDTRQIYRPRTPPKETLVEVKDRNPRSVRHSATPPKKTTRQAPQGSNQRKQYETAGDLVRRNFLAGENVGEDGAGLSEEVSKEDELRRSYASLRSLQGDSLFIGVDDEEKVEMERKKPGAVRVDNERNYARNGQHRPQENLGRGFESQDSVDNEEGMYLDRFMIKNLPR